MYTKKQHDLRIQQAQDPYGVALLQKHQLEICRQQLDSALKDAEKIEWHGTDNSNHTLKFVIHHPDEIIMDKQEAELLDDIRDILLMMNDALTVMPHGKVRRPIWAYLTVQQCEALGI